MSELANQYRSIGTLGIAILALTVASCWGCGTGGSAHTQSMQHNVSLSWTASVSPGVRYYVYRGTQHSGPYPVRLNSSPQAATKFTDFTVQTGTTYYYVVTAVDANQVESNYSNEAAAVIP